MTAGAFDWQQIDHGLVRLKMLDLASQMRDAIEKDKKRIAVDNRDNRNDAAIPAQILQMQEQRTNEWAEKSYLTYCDVWEKQGYAKTPDFVRAIAQRVIPQLIEARRRAVSHELERSRAGIAESAFKGTLDGFRRRMGLLANAWERRLEIEAKEYEHRQQTATAPSGTKRSPKPKPPCFEPAVKLLKGNPQISPLEFCRIMDAKADRYPTTVKYRPPARWKVGSFFEQYRKRSNTVSKFLSDVRKTLKTNPS